MCHSTVESQVERCIVRKLVRYLKALGWKVENVYNGEDIVDVRTEKEIMKAVFETDYARLIVKGPNDSHGSVVLVVGNGEDIISDYSWPMDDRSFYIVMNAFDDLGGRGIYATDD